MPSSQPPLLPPLMLMPMLVPAHRHHPSSSLSLTPTVIWQCGLLGFGRRDEPVDERHEFLLALGIAREAAVEGRGHVALLT
jgi:hypothetical protein